jgi:FKBP-type peptidyl-prolyl cis-trans isomerase
MIKISKLLSTFLILLVISSCEKDGVTGSESTRIDEYIAANNLVVTEKTESGLVYIRTAPNPSGNALAVGQTVNVNYAGRLLSDKEFDAGNFSFPLGVGYVVRGFDEGIYKMRVGEKATIIFPSTLGYGNQAQGSIPKNSPLILDIEVVSAK